MTKHCVCQRCSKAASFWGPWRWLSRESPRQGPPKQAFQGKLVLAPGPRAPSRPRGPGDGPRLLGHRWHILRLAVGKTSCPLAAQGGEMLWLGQGAAPGSAVRPAWGGGKDRSCWVGTGGGFHGAGSPLGGLGVFFEEKPPGGTMRASERRHGNANMIGPFGGPLMCQGPPKLA